MNIIKEYRKQKGFTQQDLATICGVSVLTVKRWESNKSVPTLHHAAKIYEVLKIPLKKLIDEYKTVKEVTDNDKTRTRE